MNTIRVKLLRRGDEDLLARATVRFNDIEISTARARVLLDDKTFIMVVALDETDEIMGRVYAHILIRPSQSDLFLYEVDVDEAYQRRGAGRAMLEYLKTFCAERGLREMFVLTESDNVAGNALYKSAGGIIEHSPANQYVYFTVK